MRPGEYEAVGDLVVEAYRTLGDAGDSFYEQTLRGVAGRAANDEVLVVEMGGRVVGSATFANGRSKLSEVDDPDAATIRMLGVANEARGRGIGEMLVLACVDRAREAGLQRVRLVSPPTPREPDATSRRARPVSDRGLLVQASCDGPRRRRRVFAAWSPVRHPGGQLYGRCFRRIVTVVVADTESLLLALSEAEREALLRVLYVVKDNFWLDDVEEALLERLLEPLADSDQGACSSAPLLV